VALGLTVLVWASTTGPAEIVGSTGRTRARPADLHSPSATASSSTGPVANSRATSTGQKYDLHWIGDLILWSLFLLAAVVVLLLLRWAWENRWRRPPRPETAEFDVLPDVDAVAGALSRDARAQLDAVAGGSPRNGIVRCWLRLEEATAGAGLPREPWETAAEFTVRVLRTLDIDPRAIGTLARLYREARFSEHEIGEDARTSARSALHQLHSDLQELGVPVSREGGR
jgi:hypothetical protein